MTKKRKTTTKTERNKIQEPETAYDGMRLTFFDSYKN